MVLGNEKFFLTCLPIIWIKRAKVKCDKYAFSMSWNLWHIGSFSFSHRQCTTRNVQLFKEKKKYETKLVRKSHWDWLIEVHFDSNLDYCLDISIYAGMNWPWNCFFYHWPVSRSISREIRYEVFFRNLAFHAGSRDN